MLSYFRFELVERWRRMGGSTHICSFFSGVSQKSGLVIGVLFFKAFLGLVCCLLPSPLAVGGFKIFGFEELVAPVPCYEKKR